MARKTKKTSRKKKMRKKSPAKKSAPKKMRRRKTRRKTHLSAGEIKHFRQLLFNKWQEIVGDVNTMENGALKKSRLDASGDLSSMPIHMADIGTDNYEQEFALGLLDGERKLLTEISDALQRIEDGTYGICEGTDGPIPKARLEASPWARYCVEYARKVEQGLVGEVGEELYELEEELEELEEQVAVMEDDDKSSKDKEGLLENEEELTEDEGELMDEYGQE